MVMQNMYSYFIIILYNFSENRNFYVGFWGKEINVQCNISFCVNNGQTNDSWQFQNESETYIEVICLA